MSAFPRFFREAVGKFLERDVSLSKHSSFKIGGKADFFYEALNLEDLKAAVAAARRGGVRYFVIGGGYNLLFDDEGYRGLIVKNSAADIRPGLKSNAVEALSGTPLSEVVEYAARRGHSGLEFLVGIPGTVGGAVFGNAGAFGKGIGDLLLEAVLLDERGKEKKVGRDYFGFTYRRSLMRDRREILLSVVLGLRQGIPEEIRSRMEDYLSQREGKHPPRDSACAGCYFKNPVLADGTKIPAGKVLEEAGAMGLKRGGASVSSRHCNFILNVGGATSRDVLSLAEELKIRVRQRYGVDLEEEVIYLPKDASMP